MVNINVELFKRYAPKKKLEIIEALTENELKAISFETIKRMIKEAGTNFNKSRDKKLFLSSKRTTGNNWNSTINGVELIKGGLFVSFYIQYENTDTETNDRFSKFITSGEYQGEIKRDDRYGNPRTYYFIYDESDKLRFIRRLLMEYVYTKYSDKLKEDGKNT